MYSILMLDILIDIFCKKLNIDIGGFFFVLFKFFLVFFI